MINGDLVFADDKLASGSKSKDQMVKMFSEASAGAARLNIIAIQEALKE
jgi:hypothetical protein